MRYMRGGSRAAQRSAEPATTVSTNPASITKTSSYVASTITTTTDSTATREATHATREATHRSTSLLREHGLIRCWLGRLRDL